MTELLTKTICQHSKNINADDMKKLEEIACSYAQVKNIVYLRYGGVGSLSKLYPGYTIQNEMTQSGVRKKIGLPVPYFYPAVFEALADIKSGWKHLRKNLARQTMANANLTEQEKHYICYLLKNDALFTKVVSREEFDPPPQLQKLCDREESEPLPLEQKKLHNYICRQVRKMKPEYEARRTNSFQVTPKGYRYGEGGIYLTTKEPRKRVFLPLTDSNRYERQLSVILKEDSAVFHVPVGVKPKKHPDYVSEVALALGYEVMFTTSDQREYGAEYGFRRSSQIEVMKHVNTARRTLQSICEKHRTKGNTGKAINIENNNLGRRKYDRWKEKQTQALKAYINAEIERMFREEKPAVLYIPRLGNSGRTHSRLPAEVSGRLSGWQRGYITKRLSYKCQLNGISLVEVKGREFSLLCSECGGRGAKEKGIFHCLQCGREIKAGVNTAENILRYGREQTYAQSRTKNRDKDANG